MKNFKIILFITLYILSCLLFISCTKDNKDYLQVIKDRGVLRVAVFSDKPPFGYVDKEGKSQGYDIELAKALAKELFNDETKVEYILTEAQHRVDVLKSNKVDITLANFTITKDRLEQVDFAKPYMKTSIGIVSNNNNLIKNINDLLGKTIIVNKGTTAENYFAKNYPNIKLLKFDHNSEAFAALRDGRGVALAHDNALLYAWTNENKDFSVSIDNVGENDFIAPAVKKGNAKLLSWINDVISKLQKEEFFHKAYDKSVKSFYGENINADNIVIDASNLNK